MNGCQDQRAAMLDLEHLDAEGRASVEQHLLGCAACAEWGKRLRARESLIGSLPRILAPAELSSRVVAAIQAGERQERAIRAVRGLGRLRSPSEMDDAVAAQARRASRDPLAELAGRRPAPSVLARLVSEELRDPAKARVARHVSSLPRFEAPVELEARVRRDFGRVPVRRPRAFLTVLAALAAGLLAAVLLPQLQGGPKYPFRVVHVGSLDDLDPAARSIVEMTAGMARQELP